MKQWDRIEPHTRSEALEDGLEACTADAAWLLARQWQVGEFRGEDAASPVLARLQVGWAPIATFRNDAARNPSSEPISSDEPLEVRVEAMAVEHGPAAFALAAEAGLQFSRRLDAEGLGALRSKCRARFALELDPELLLGLPPREQVRLRWLARRAPDGRKLLAATDVQIQALGTSATERAALGRVLARWRPEQAQRFARPGASGETWIDERLEHRFSVAAPTDSGDVVLGAAQYPGGRLDWHSFEITRTGAAGTRPTPLQTRTLELLPTPLAYAGMPAARWWEREEGSVYFGAIDASPADISRLTLVEYATVYSNDWFVLPVRLPIGSLARVQRLRLSDTFGGVHPILPAAFLDVERLSRGGPARRPWAFFELTGDPSPGRTVRRSPAGDVLPADEAAIAPWLVLPSVVSSAQSGKPVERVGFVRDEGANLAWAIESTIEGPSGRPIQRRLQWGLARQASAESDRIAAAPEPTPVVGSEPWRYRLQTFVPPHWIPLMPEPVGTNGEVRLRRARMSQWDDIPQTWAKGPKGQILAPSRPLWLFEEEVPRGGIEVTRRWQLTRSSDGRLRLWMGREKRPGRGERASGFEQDVLLRRGERR